MAMEKEKCCLHQCAFAEISIKFKIYPEESTKIGRNGTIDSNYDPALQTLVGLYDRTNYPNVGIFEYLANRLLRNKELSSVTLGDYSDVEEKAKRIFAQEQKFDQTKDYLAQLKIQDLYVVQKVLENSICLQKRNS